MQAQPDHEETVGSYLSSWLQHARSRVRAKTYEGYQGLVRLYALLVQRTWQDDAGNKRHSVEIQVSHVGPDLQFATAEVTKSSAEGLGSPSDGPSAASSAEEKQRA
jgi:hypothetical protein